uniref:metallophosphoesterase n=1 Tax=Exiguobacterium sp. TaxID=44751 RepID=UPI0028B0A96F
MRKRTRWLLSLGVLALGSWFLYRENNIIDVSQVTVASSRLPEAFNGYRVVQVADLHGKTFGNEQQRLLKKINQAEPDLIVMTGDLIDSRRNGEEAALTLMKALVDGYPFYFVTGNHEVRLN